MDVVSEQDAGAGPDCIVKYNLKIFIETFSLKSSIDNTIGSPGFLSIPVPSTNNNLGSDSSSKYGEIVVNHKESSTIHSKSKQDEFILYIVA